MNIARSDQVTRLDALRRRHSWDVVTELVVREFRLRYRRAVFGWLWAVSTPIARLVILSFVFTRVLPLDIPNYPVFVFVGIITWTWFSAGLGSATSSAVDRRDLFFRPGLPRAAVPVVSVLTDGLDLVAALPVLAIFLLLGDGIPVTALILPGLLAFQLMLVLGLGFALSAANVYFRDVHLFVDVALLLGFYVTPVFYDARSIPAPYGDLLGLNPMAQLLGAYRSVLIAGRLPDPLQLLLVGSVCAAIFAGGYAIYRAASPSFVDEL